jgi:hypothetical protein
MLNSRKKEKKLRIKGGEKKGYEEKHSIDHNHWLIKNSELMNPSWQLSLNSFSLYT